MSSSRERWARDIPVDSWVFEEAYASKYIPETPIQALMETLPNEKPLWSRIERHSIREILNDAIEDTLDPLEMWVFNALHVERKSLRKVGKELSIPKTTISRIRDRAAKKLQKKLSSNETIQEYLKR